LDNHSHQFVEKRKKDKGEKPIHWLREVNKSENPLLGKTKEGLKWKCKAF
jgi:hypothetical protein